MGLFTSSGKTKVTQEAAKREPDYQNLWDEFIGSVYGADFDSAYYLSKYPDVERYYKEQMLENGSPGYLKRYGEAIASGMSHDEAIKSLPVTPALEAAAREHYEKYGKAEGRQGWSPATQGPNLQDKFAQENAAREAADRQLITDMRGISGDYLAGLRGTTQDRIGANDLYGNKMTGITEGYLSQLARDTGKYRGELGGIMDTVRPVANSAPVNFRFGDFQTPVITGHQRYAQGTLADLANQDFAAGKGLGDAQYEKGGTLAQLINNLSMNNAGFRDILNQETAAQQGNIAQMENAAGRTYTPNAAGMQYLQFLIDNFIKPNEQARFQIPTTTEQGSYTPSAIGAIGDIASIASKAFPLGFQG